jgi:hypothetical protein
MENIDKTPQSKGKTLKEQYVPYEKRASQNVKAMDYIKELAPIICSGLLGALTGRIGGKFLEARNVKIKSIPINGDVGGWFGGKIGGVYGLFHHWKKTEGRRLGVSAISSDLNTVLSAEHLESQARKQAEIIEGIKTLQNMPLSQKSYVEEVTSRREAMAGSLGKA